MRMLLCGRDSIFMRQYVSGCSFKNHQGKDCILCMSMGANERFSLNANQSIDVKTKCNLERKEC